MQGVNYTSQHYVNDIVQLFSKNYPTVAHEPKFAKDREGYAPFSLRFQTARVAKQVLLKHPEQRPPNWSSLKLEAKTWVLISADSWQEWFSLKPAMPPGAIEESARRMLAYFGSFDDIIHTKERPEYISLDDLKNLINGNYPSTYKRRADNTSEERLLRLTFWNLCRGAGTPEERVRLMNKVIGLADKVTDIKEARKQTLQRIAEKLEMAGVVMLQKKFLRSALRVVILVCGISLPVGLLTHGFTRFLLMTIDRIPVNWRWKIIPAIIGVAITVMVLTVRLMHIVINRIAFSMDQGISLARQNLQQSVERKQIGRLQVGLNEACRLFVESATKRTEEHK